MLAPVVRAPVASPRREPHLLLLVMSPPPLPGQRLQTATFHYAVLWIETRSARRELKPAERTTWSHIPQPIPD